MQVLAGNSIEEILEVTGSLLKGHFELSSGLHSNRYFQCAKLFQYPDIASMLVKELSSSIDFDVDIVVGPAIGGIIPAYEMAKALNKRAAFVERKDGEMQLRRGFTIKENERILIMEDVITTAKSAGETTQILKKLGGKIAGYACIVDRTNNTTDLNIKSLIKVEAVTYSPEQCPLCKEQIIIDKPGSRNC